MSTPPTVVLPIRGFAGMTRLRRVLNTPQRAALIRELSERSADAVLGADLRAVVVSSDEKVIDWADSRDLSSTPDPGRGLSAAATAATEILDGSPWIVLHSDLPRVTSAALRRIADVAIERTVLVPSHDGGTNVIASRGHFPFMYGPGSFHRHFAAVPLAVVTSSAGLSIDIDSPTQLAGFPELSRTVMVGP